ncbi:4-demethylwyosine synthase TYW1 [Candidatus Bathyarchaeota archaeon]|nr:MAG: 4-demethylwyosine synthase TYW1 [Candidatus Bathyarchaeota archaeon]
MELETHYLYKKFRNSSLVKSQRPVDVNEMENAGSSLEFREILYRQGYRIVGNHCHSAVKICQWTKESLRNNRVCYKELWYPPVESHRCMMMTPYLGCNLHCLHCWRLHSGDRLGLVWKEFPLEIEDLDEPAQIIDEAIKQRKLLLSGWKGNPRVDKKKFEEALNPSMMTMSLTGEPTLYPMISEMVDEARKRGMITFLVTNGTIPEALERMENLPFQLYISILATSKKDYIRLARPLIRDAWERLNETIDLLPSLDTRRVLRLTMMKGYNMMDHEGYAEIIERAQPDFVEVKAYEWVGESQRRLPRSAMPYMNDIEEFAEKLSTLTGYTIKGRFKPSGVVLLVG